MSERDTNTNDVADILSRTPSVLRALLCDLPDAWLRATERDGAWSPYDVVGHLIHGERTDWIPRVRHILSGETRPFEAFDRTGHFGTGDALSLDELLTTFASLRSANLATLVDLALTADDLQRRGQHPELGEVTLGQLLATWVAHDFDHIAQIARTMAKQYRQAVGPWQAYLSVLHDREPPK